ncbi:MAG: ATP-dependent helicase HrpB [Gammaproteobacteria bacterium]|nr:ATP-dependent helicase HrpB [Gammaproteobacteria bacterium]
MTLPIEEAIPQLRAALAAHRSVVLQAPPGAGKTTRVPVALLGESWLAGRSIVILEPRRLAARAAAARMAQHFAEPVGATAGYRIRFENRVSARTRIEVVTEGILTRRLQADPMLDGVGMVVFDEFHERHLHGDLALALTLDIQRGLREDLRVLVMSATLDGAAVARLLGQAPVISSPGSSFPVSVQYCERDPAGLSVETVAQTVAGALCTHAGDVLAFLPGAREIHRARELLEGMLPRDTAEVLPLYGDLPWALQERAILSSGPGNRRKVVLATTIAESSLTIDGVRVVVDSGYARVPQFDPKSGLTRLVTQRISRASAEQRSGRAGRTAPGICLRLWSENTHRGLMPQALAEIRGADLAPLALELAAWGVGDAASLSWLDPPPAAALAQANDLLRQLDAIDASGRITDIGRRMAQLPLHPRLSHMLMAAREPRLAALACDVAAVISERDVLAGEARQSCDLSARIDALREFRAGGRRAAQARGADPERCMRADQASRQFRRLIAATAPDDVCAATDIGALVALAYPDRIAMQRAGAGSRYVLVNGRGARLPELETGLRQPFLAVANADPAPPEAAGGGRRPGAAANSEGLIHLAAVVDGDALERLFPGRVCSEDVVRWDAQQQSVIARRERRMGALLLASAPVTGAPAAQLRAAVLEGVRQLGLQVLPWSGEARQWQSRVLCMRSWFPEEDWPDVSDHALAATLDEWLAPHLDGITRREQFARLDLVRILAGSLDWDQVRRLERDAPARIRVPSGSLITLEYQTDAAPVLAVKLQELFGLADTPRVARDRVPVTLHLLSPARRPIQVTQDLCGFWNRTYAEVRKELKARYPKHPWPDDPWKALPTARSVRRR